MALPRGTVRVRVGLPVLHRGILQVHDTGSRYQPTKTDLSRHCKHGTARCTFLALLGSNKVINSYPQNAPFIIIDSNIVDDSWGAVFPS
jgi:hypothetical protein